MPFLRVLVLAFALVHATGLSDAMEVACAEMCAEGEDCGDEGCAPICPTCHCAPCPPGVPAPTASVIAAFDPSSSDAAFHHVDDVVTSPDPREILRVPIALRV